LRAVEDKEIRVRRTEPKKRLEFAAMSGLLILFTSVPVLSAGNPVVDRIAGLPSTGIRALAFEDGKVWIGTANRGVVLWDPALRKATDFSGEAGFTSKEIASIAVFQGMVYAGTARELMVYNGTNWNRMEKIGNVTLRNVILAVTPDGKELWASAMTLAGGTVRFDGIQWTFMGGGGRGLFNDIASFAFAKNGTWMGSVSGTVYLHQGTDVGYFRKGISGSVFALAETSGGLTAGTSDGLFRLEGDVWKRIDLPAEWGKERVYSMASRENTLYLATPEGLGRIGGGRFDRLTAAEGLPAAQVEVVAVHGETVYAGTSGGLVAIRGW
jgi:ligand-binding sensor domain-containing protein